MPRRASIAIHLLLAAQIVFPLHYYTCNSDMRDERFAWRMSSSTRLEKCSAQFFVGDAPSAIEASSEFHNTWVGIAQHGRQQVIMAMAAWLCEKHPDSGVRVRVLCEQHPETAARGKSLLYDPSQAESNEMIEMVSRGIFDFCITGEL